MPKVTVTVNTRSLAAHRQQLIAARPRLAASAAQDGLLMARMGAQLGIYGTAPGKRYVRSNRYLDSIYATPLPGTLLGVRVGDTAPYADYLELGTQGNDLTPTAAKALAEAVGVKPSGLYLGRSGENYVAPNPAITRAGVWAMLRLAEAYGQVLAGKGTTGLSFEAAAD